MLLLSIILFHLQLKITMTRFFCLFFSLLIKLVTYIIIHSNILLLTCIYVLPLIFHCIICFYLFNLWRFNKVNQSINYNSLRLDTYKLVRYRFTAVQYSLEYNWIKSNPDLSESNRIESNRGLGESFRP